MDDKLRIEKLEKEIQEIKKQIKASSSCWPCRWDIYKKRPLQRRKVKK